MKKKFIHSLTHVHITHFRIQDPKLRIYLLLLNSTLSLKNFELRFFLYKIAFKKNVS